MGPRTERGLRFLAKVQGATGSFAHLSSPHPDKFTKSLTYTSPFFTALITSCLRSLPESSERQGISQKAAAYLESQVSKNGSVNYWDTSSPEYTQLPYPNDLDDTFCLLAALQLAQPSLISGETLAKTVKLLTHAEVKPGGPYRTWLVSGDSAPIWQDVDLAVNNNIAYFLSLQEITLPHLVELTETAILEGKLSSPYYPSLYPIAYFISRWYRGVQAPALIQQIEEAVPTTALERALKLTTLIHLGSTSKVLGELATHLEQAQSPDGSWPAAAFCLDPAIKKVPHYAGSKAATTAFCLEALQLYSQLEIGESAPAPAETKLYQAVLKKMHRDTSMLAPPMRKRARQIIAHTASKDRDRQIGSLGLWTREALSPANQSKVSDALLKNIGAISFHGWIAYSIYDDFLDAEGESTLLPLANFSLRTLSLELSQLLPEHPAFFKYAEAILNQLEAANLWEVSHCRFDPKQSPHHLPRPDFGDLHQLADRSLGHALGPLAILTQIGYAPTSPEADSLLAYFKHYIIARQLNDDAHDWEEDLKRGQLNAVSALLLEEYRREHPLRGKLEDHIIPLRKLFWNQTIVTVGEIIFEHIEKAQKALVNHPVIVHPEPLLKLLTPIIRATNKALEEQKRTQDFIRTYSAKD